MRSARQRDEHRAALDRRMGQLRAELVGPAGTRVRPPVAERPSPAAQQAAPPPGWHGGPAVDPPTDPGAGPAHEPPGRHAARSTPRWELTTAHLRVVAVLVVLALLLTGWWLLRSRPEAIPQEVGLTVTSASPEPSAADATRADQTSRGSGAEPKPEKVVVHVAGRVRRPGIVRLAAGSRVMDALEAAGGPRPGVRLRDLNLARAVVDGEQVLVGLPGQSAPAAGGTDEAGDPLVNLNTADQAELETLPGVGPVTAEKILRWREEHGRFTAVEELLEVDGIGDATLADLAPLVTV